MKEIKKNLEKMTKAELIDLLRSLQGKDAERARRSDELKRALHDLEVHQVELEMQNRELRETHQLLEESRDRYADLYDFAPVSFVTLDANGRILEANLTLAATLDVERPKLIGTYLSRFLIERDRLKLLSFLRGCDLSGELKAIEVELQVARNRRMQTEFLIAPFHPTNESAVSYRVAITDVTERKAAAEVLSRARDDLEGRVAEKTLELSNSVEALRAEVVQHGLTEAARIRSEQNYRAIFDAVNDAVFVHDIKTGEILDANRRACEMYGYSLDEIKGASIEDLSAGKPYTQDEAFRWIRKAADGEPQLFDWAANDSSGRLFWVEVNLKRATIGGEQRLLAVVRDITRRKEANERLRELADLLNHAQEAITVRDIEGRVLFWNAGAEKMFGWSGEEALGNRIDELVFQADSRSQFQEANRAVLERGEWAGEIHQVDKTGREVVVESRWTLVRRESGEPVSVLVISLDITEKKSIEAQFLRAQRMEGIGALAAGIAHDINNILSPIVMVIHFLQSKYKEDSDTRELLSALKRNALLGGEMVKQILEFARGARGERIMLQPAHVIKDTLELLEKTLPRSIEIKRSIPHSLWPMTADPTQFHQVLINLCLNARDAMPDGGSIAIAAENVTIDEHYARMYTDLKPGRYVAISVTDTGTGIPVNLIEKIFDPFFTTKESGAGTGLGLSTVLGIVKGHGGSISVHSRPGSGAVFRVLMPAGQLPESFEYQSPQVEPIAGHGEVILVADDEASIREISRKVLEAGGYHVLAASEGAEALALYADNHEKVELVLADLMMPLMDGITMIRALRKLDPGVKIIVSTGFEIKRTALESMDLKVQGFLSKPYTAESLLAEIASALGRAPEAI